MSKIEQTCMIIPEKNEIIQPDANTHQNVTLVSNPFHLKSIETWNHPLIKCGQELRRERRKKERKHNN
jgi:hypothetical protein